jgi:hypothetical protein
MSTVEDVNVLSSGGDAYLKLTVSLPNSSLASIYREMLAVPSEATLGEVMQIPEVARAEFYRSVKQEQKFSFGFMTQILGSSMVPRSENDELKVSVNAFATLQVTNVTASGADGIWEIKIGPKNDDTAKAMAGYLFSKIMFAQMLLKSLDGEQIYEASHTMRVSLPKDGTLLNGAELSGLSCAMDFGGGTSVTSRVSVVESTVVYDERTLIREQNITRSPTEIYEIFRDNKAFTIKCLIPDSASVGRERFESGVFERDFHWDWEADVFSEKWSKVFSDTPGLEVTLDANASLTIFGGIAWDFDWDWWPPHWYLDWFKAWIGAATSVGISLDVKCTNPNGMAKVWDDEQLYKEKLHKFSCWCGIVPVWANLNLRVLADVDVGASTALNLHYGVEAGAEFTAGIKWDSGWSPIWEWNTWNELEWPSMDVVQANGWAKATLRFRLEFMIYDEAGPYLELAPYADLRFTNINEEFTRWTVTLGLKLNIGVTFDGWLADMLDLDDKSTTLWEDVIQTWNGWFGKAPTYISVSLDPDSTYIGGGTTIMGTISSEYGTCSLEGRVKIQISSDNITYTNIGRTISHDDGTYSYWWVPSSAGTFSIRSLWLGNNIYTGATSDPVTLSVSPITMGVQELKEHDGDKAGQLTLQYPGGLAVHFIAPKPDTMLLKIKIMGAYEGVDGLFYLEVWNSSFNEVFSSSYSIYSVFNPSDVVPWEWAEINIPNVAVSGDFFIAISAYETLDSKLMIGTCPVAPGMYAWDSCMVNIEDNAITELPPPTGHRNYYLIRAIVDTALLDHTMCKGITGETTDGQPVADGHPVLRTNDFCITDDYAYSWVKFAPDMGLHTLEWRLFSPDYDFLYSTSNETSLDWDGIAWVSIPIASISEWLTPYLGQTFHIMVYLDGDHYFTESCRVWEEYAISVTLSQNYIVFGESLEISSQTSPGFALGTTKIQYRSGSSLELGRWNNISIGDPESGYYSCNWVPPHAGTYFIRATWGEYLYYSTMESSPQTLMVNQASTELSTSLNSTMAFAVSNITITAAMTPALSGMNISFQYSPDDLTWYHVSAGTTNSTGQCDCIWTVVDIADHCYIRTFWTGEDDYSGTASPSKYLTILPQNVTNVVSIRNVTLSQTEIVQGDPLSINVEIENLGNDTVNVNILTLANDTLIESKLVSLEKNESSTVTFIWDTSDFALGNCSVQICALSDIIEDNFDDNIFVRRVVMVPEFSPLAMLSVFTLTSLVAIVLYKKKRHFFR